MTGAPGRASRPIVAGAVALLLVAEGLASIRIGYASYDFRHAVFVLLAGLLVGAAGLVTWYRRPESRTGMLLVGAAATWYVGGFRWVAFDPIAIAADALDLVYAGVLTHAILTYPTGRARSAMTRFGVAAAYAASLVPAPRADVLVAAILLLGLAGMWLREPTRRHERTPAAIAGVVFALALIGTRAVPSGALGLGTLDLRPFLHLGLVIVALALALPLAGARRYTQRLTDVAVELASDAGADIARQLGELVGDPGLRIDLWDRFGGRYLDEDGRPRSLAAGAGRTVTIIEVDGQPIAAVEHLRSVRLDERTRIVLGRAVELAASNARLRAEVRDKVLEVRASRRRLLLSADEERERLEQQLVGTLDPQLDALEARLAGDPGPEDVVVRTAREQVRQTRLEIASLVRGWGPPALDGRGMAGALAELASRAPVPVALELSDVQPPSRLTQSTLVFVASEALANVAKHAAARQVVVRLSQTPDEVRLEVDDDGRGGADVAAGTGLQGLQDRVESVGGRLSIDSRPGVGTRVLASVPRVEAGA